MTALKVESYQKMTPNRGSEKYVEDEKQESGNEEMVTDMDDIQTQENVNDSEGDSVPYTRRGGGGGYRDSGKTHLMGKKVVLFCYSPPPTTRKFVKLLKLLKMKKSSIEILQILVLSKYN